MSKNQIRQNVLAHDRVSGIYERIHGEIYNQREQDRLARELKAAVMQIGTGQGKPQVLDFGCGAGNLTAHLISAGCEVISSDVSPKFLRLVQDRFGVRTFQLNGENLSGIETESLDMVATYSVLHHVPDYLGILEEFARVLRPGGVLYIDHESSPNVWTVDPVYAEFERCMRDHQSFDLIKYMNPYNYADFLVRKFVNPRYRREGDIHVFPDDHIQWELVASRLDGLCRVVTEKPYLLFKRGYDEGKYEQFVGRTSDMQLMVFKKNAK